METLRIHGARELRLLLSEFRDQPADCEKIYSKILLYENATPSHIPPNTGTLFSRPGPGIVDSSN